MQKDLIVVIFTPTGAKGATPGVIGTGYPVTDDLILTSRHVVAPKNRNPQEPITVKWFYDQPAGHWIPIEPADLVWTGPGDLDAALIRCRRPEHLRRFTVGQLVERRPVDGERWQSAGFARANKRDDVREPGKFGGTLRSMAEADAFFELLEGAEPAAEKQWQGASGMPVFAGFEILGVVKHVPPNFKHKKLEAVPAWRLLQDEGFKKALNWDEKRERLEAARKWLYHLLEGSDEGVRGLAADLKLSCSDIPKCRDQVVDELLNKTPPLERLFELALSVQMQRRNVRDQTGAQVVAELVLTILPAIHDAAIVAHVRRRKSDASECIIALPTELRTLAEIIMAGADRRSALLWPMPRSGYFPEGKLSLPEPPEWGRDADNKQIRSDLLAGLLDAFAKGHDRFEGDFRTYLKERFIQSNQRSSDTINAEERLRQAVAEELRFWAEEEHLTYYFIAEMHANPAIRQAQEVMLAKLKQDFPAIAFLRLAGGEGLAAERGRYRKLCNLLYQDPEAGR